jgi:two-component system, response regulator PdtaR
MPLYQQANPGTASLNDGKLRIFIVEDEAMLAFVLEQDLADAGYATVGPYRNLAAARRAAAEENFDMAILDINLSGELAYPLAEDLAQRNIPFFFLSGYGGESIPVQFRNVPRLAKPYDIAQLLREVETLV